MTPERIAELKKKFNPESRWYATDQEKFETISECLDEIQRLNTRAHPAAAPSDEMLRSLKVLNVRRERQVAPYRIDDALKQLGLDTANWLNSRALQPRQKGVEDV